MSTEARVIKLRRSASWRPPENLVIVARPSKWGNPFSHLEASAGKYKVATQAEAVEAYREWIVEQPELMADIKELKGKALGCWCKSGPCHAYVLLELANPEIPTQKTLF